MVILKLYQFPSLSNRVGHPLSGIHPADSNEGDPRELVNDSCQNHKVVNGTVTQKDCR